VKQIYGNQSDDRLPVIVDSREQRPYFTSHQYDTKIAKVVKGLKSGDYSLADYEDKIAIERKSLADLFGSLTRHRKRFEREIQRLQDYEFSAVVVEASLPQILHPMQYCPGWRSKASPKAIIQTILTWMVRYPKTHWVFGHDRPSSEAVVLNLLRHFWNGK